MAKKGVSKGTQGVSKRNVKTTSNVAPEVIVNASSEVVVSEPSEVVVSEPSEVVVSEPSEVIINEPPTEVKETPKDRKVRVFWHKRCTNVKESTETTLRANEHLRLTDGSVTIEENILPVYSLKRGNRIYYLYDVLPIDVKIAQEIKAAKDKLKEAEKNVKAEA